MGGKLCQAPACHPTSDVLVPRNKYSEPNWNSGENNSRAALKPRRRCLIYCSLSVSHEAPNLIIATIAGPCRGEKFSFKRCDRWCGHS